MNLFLMRHGQAFSAFEDPNRGLTDKGRADVLAVIKQSPVSPGDIDHVMHSAVTRTEQTAEIVADLLHIARVTACPKWLAEDANIDRCLMMLPTWQENVLLVSHQPFLVELVSYLIPSQITEVGVFATATLLCLKKNSEDNWRLQWVVSP